MLSGLQEILQQMATDGISPKELIPDEKLHRFPASHDDKKNSGWYRCYRNQTKHGVDFFVCVYGDHHEAVTYKAQSNVKLDKHDKARVNEQIAAAKRAHDAEIKKLREDAARTAKAAWEKFSPAFGRSLYLEKKKLTQLFGARIDGFDVVVPMRDIDGEIRNIERISNEGRDKKGLFGGKRSGLFHLIGDAGTVIYVCEGFATAASVHMATGQAAACAFNAGNLVDVSTALARKYPEKRIVVCGDNDRFTKNTKGEPWNPGREKAEEAANAAGGKWVLPEFQDESDGTDFNDLYIHEGLEAVAEQIEAVKPDELVETFSRDYVIHTPYPDENPKTFAKKGTLANVVELLRRLRIRVRYNVISKEEEVLIPGVSFTLDNQANASLAYIIDWCERVGISSGNLIGYLTAIADLNPYNPIATWIESSPWDGESRLKEFFDTVRCAGDNSFKEKLILKWLVSAVASLYEKNGISAHGVLVFQGKQYLGKTMWFKRLVPQTGPFEFLSTGQSLRPDDKDSVARVIGKWIVELGELDSTFRKSDISQLKAFITNDKDIIRRPYARRESCYPRRTVFFGSVNDCDFLKDQTGNRRFWTIECTELDYLHEIDMQQLWAEVRVLYLAGESWLLSNEEVVTLNSHNEQFEETSSIEERIRESFLWDWKRTQRMSASVVCQRLGITHPSNHDCKQVGAALRKITGHAPRKSNGLLVFELPPHKEDPAILKQGGLHVVPNETDTP